MSKLATHYGFVDRGRVVREIAAEEIGEGESLEDYYMDLIGGGQHD